MNVLSHIVGDHPAVSAIVCLYAVLSLLTFILYAIDKTAARRQARRIPENTLHIYALLGGWPGALLAQQLLRHKSVKRSFRIRFWMTLLLNLLLASLVLLPGIRPGH